MHPAHHENEYLPITFIEPVAPNLKALGLDMAHENNRYAAAEKAHDSGLAQVTDPIVLVQDSEKTPGFLFYAPFYHDGPIATIAQRRQRFAGMVYAPFVAKKLMQGVLGREHRPVGIRISDNDDVLYDEHHAGESDFDADPLFKHEFNVERYGRRRRFDIWSDQSFPCGRLR